MEAVGRPKSSLAQIVTAIAAILVLVVVVGTALLLVEAAQRTAAAPSVSVAQRATVATVQASCLDYIKYVHDQYRAGLSVDQIEATLHQAAKAGEPIHAQGLRLDDPTVCGSVSAVLHGAGLK
ncbi:hypothetical protein ACWIGW_44245 [Nocardia brasiliensis]|uniref:hypothetical protein n=1 Tax=Streptomyces sp. NPDC056056 TaxID=3345698 RepID=UPI0035D93CE7